MAEKRSFERTSYEVRQRWDKENLKKYSVALHSRNDAALIDYIEGRKSKGDTISTIFREAIEALIKEG